MRKIFHFTTQQTHLRNSISSPNNYLDFGFLINVKKMSIKTPSSKTQIKSGGIGTVPGILIGVLVFELLKIITQFLGI